MRVLFSGRWGDTYLFDIVIGGLKDSNKGFPQEQIEVMTDGSETSKRGAAMAEARHRLKPVEGGVPQVVFCLHDDLPMDERELERLMEFNKSGIPIYHIRHMDRDTLGRLLSAARTRRVRAKGKRSAVPRERSGGPRGVG